MTRSGTTRPLAQRLRQHVKVAALARQAVHTQHNVVRFGRAPFPIGHAVARALIGQGK
jgi:hypothetical protein